MENYLRKFLEHQQNLDEIERRGDESYGIEFMKLREFSQNIKTENHYSSSEGEKPINIHKNRYKDIVPFDFCRVKLKRKSDETDYINASFIKVSNWRQNYIAAQGPLPKTVDDFWAMIWDYDVTMVVMACQEMEGFPPKCQRYWNISKEEELKFGSLTVRMVLPRAEETIICRKLLVTDGKSKRNVTHLHYTKWPDKFVPKCIDSIIRLITAMREIHPIERPEPLVVHCSAGCGRTGTIMVIDYVKALLDNGKITEKFNLYDVIVEMRKQRMAIVQTQEQYQYVHEAVAKLFREKLQAIESHYYGNRPSMTGNASDDGEYESVMYKPPTMPKIVMLPGPQTAKISTTDKSRTPSPKVDFSKNASYSNNKDDDNTYKNMNSHQKSSTQGLSNKTKLSLNKSLSGDRKNDWNGGGSGAGSYSRSLYEDNPDYPYPIHSEPPKVPAKTYAGQNHLLAQKTPTVEYIYRGVNIGFPVRLKKPKGPRPFRSL
ncbi:hypothetical protein HELRODRAFT_108932 [Helobdella robusta]|uniref:protein-tyrosine-phosphatase n=1 Tax=Helobdella robusta TaxID=6412 RepID=T1EEP0_HELRO|nr:hypothetical protein HELRODRAFT_108932 [Helobdella robusta]ESO11686.1 hypothetical protein HELRODRAFT_108932 [Helobdella robusta]